MKLYSKKQSNCSILGIKRLASAKEIILATESGSVERIKEIVNENSRWKDASKWISIIDKKGRTPLHLAAYHGHLELTRFIVHQLFESVLDNELRKQYVNLKDKKGRTPLFHAAAHGKYYVVRTLVERGVDLDAETNEAHAAPGSTAIMACAENNHLTCFEYLLDRGADLLAKRSDGADAYYLASMNGNTRIVKSIVTTELIRIVCHDILDKPTFRGRTPLSTAAFHGHLEIVKLLFQRGAQINHRDDDEFTPLILASYEGHLKVVKWLLRNGANLSDVDKFGDTALESAEICGHSEVASFLNKWGDVKNNPGLRKESVVYKPQRFKNMLKNSKSIILANFR